MIDACEMPCSDSPRQSSGRASLARVRWRSLVSRVKNLPYFSLSTMGLWHLRVACAVSGLLVMCFRVSSNGTARTDGAPHTNGLYFFAEDVFGNQFAFEDDRIVRYLAETGEREFCADSVADWIDSLLRDPDEELGLWLLREWRSQNETPLDFNDHLCPKIPFILGGRHEAENLFSQDRVKSMLFKGDVAWQTRNVPDGGRIKLKVTP
jgi:hypothetical protein